MQEARKSYRKGLWSIGSSPSQAKGGALPRLVTGTGSRGRPMVPLSVVVVSLKPLSATQLINRCFERIKLMDDF